MGKIITANFSTGEKSVWATGLDQYDYGAVLRIQGLNLPPAVEIHFCPQETGGEAPRRVGTTKDGVTDVVIPDSMLENGDTTHDYNIYAWVYLTDETSGSTERRITMKIRSRSKPEAFDRPEDDELFREAIAAVNEASERAEDAEKSAEAWVHGHEDYPERDEDNAAYYAGIAGGNAASAHDSMAEAQYLASQVHSDADITAQNTMLAEQYKSQAAQSAAEALKSKKNANDSEKSAQESQSRAEAAEGQAELFAQQVATDKNEVQDLVDGFDLTHQQAIADVNNTGQAQTERVQKAGETSTDNIETSRLQAVKSVSNEGESQKNAVKSEGATQVQNVQAVVNGIAQESTAKKILEKSNQSLPFLEEIARNSGKAGSLNGFGLEKGVNDSVVVTYTNPETDQFESATVLPTDTTLLKIDEALTGINESLKIIALQKGVEA